ncbi:4-galactosyl-N-acetylglucosaminide 3-alpha-L-fucosyltransferase 9-like [Brevipalpus obovatus]|uniref:4-galactosyl-N-acetylglucosaminide 3-alpha-L-fucosyltransferase 9-like n=1 Tax=Brevipalpus obovatus TaxID=246614 RepID=UPI003D9E57EA
MVISVHFSNNAETETMPEIRYTRLNSESMEKPVRLCSKLPFYSKTLFIILCISSLLTCIVYLVTSGAGQFLPETPVYEEKKPVIPKNKRLVLLWTKWWGDGTWHNFLHNSSPNCSCVFSNDRRYLEQASTLIFHGPDTSQSDLPKRIQNQTWVWYAIESPHYIFQSVKPIEHQMDCYATHRRDSDVYCPYGQTVTRALGSDVSPEITFGSRKKSIAWLVSKCKTISQREEYVKELQNFTKVDVYGGCGISCDKLEIVQRSKDDKCHTLLKDYKFYLAFENSICKDYFTEKIVTAFNLGLIPIVMGLTNYSRDFPSNSVINVFDYPSPRELAEYVEKVSTDEKLYNSYHEWRKNFTIQPSEIAKDHLCKICEEVRGNCGRRNHSMLEWWETGGQCTTWQKYLNQSNSHTI